LGFESSGVVCRYCIGVDSRNNKIYVANDYSDTVSVIDGNSDTVEKTIQVGHNPTFILVTTYPMITGNGALGPCCKIYVANTDDNAVSVIDGHSGTVEKTIPVGYYPTFILGNSPHGRIYISGIGSDNRYRLSVIDYNDTVEKTITLPKDAGDDAMFINESEIGEPLYTIPAGYENFYRIYHNSTILTVQINIGEYRCPRYDIYCDLSLRPYRIDLGNGIGKQIPSTLGLIYSFLDSPSGQEGIPRDPGIVQNTEPTLQNFSRKVYVVNRDDGTVSMIGYTPRDCNEEPYTTLTLADRIISKWEGIHRACTPILKHITV
jgi:YVTN family beta-propeller protein